MKRFLLPACLALVAACSGANSEANDSGDAAVSGDSGQAGGYQAASQQAPQKAVQAAALKGPLPKGAVRVKRVKIMDEHGFEKPMVATTLMIPADWSYEGGIVWGGQGAPCGVNYNVTFEAKSPDGKSGVAIIPQETWYWSSMGANQQNCAYIKITSVQEYLQNIIVRARPGARILDFRRRPDIEKEYAQINQQSDMYGLHSRSWIESGEALIGYQEDGVDMRETIVSAVMLFQYVSDSMNGVPGFQNINGASLPGFAMRAPNGQLDFTLAEAIRKSPVNNPAWDAKIAQFNANIARINAKGARDRAQTAADTSRMIAKTGDEIREMQMDSWKRQQDSSDYIQRESSEALRGVETYNDPYYGGTVELDNTYNDAWQLDDGSYVLSNDALFDPNVDLGVNAQKLEVTK